MKNIVAVGGLGGSGTRLVAEFLKKTGYHIGNKLNVENDNLLFTALFKNPEFYKKSTYEEIRQRLDLFYKTLKNSRFSIAEIVRLKHLINKNQLVKINCSVYSIYFGNRFVKNKRFDLLGWKEPNTHIYLRQILNFDKDLKYIHVLRNGLDMAFSENKQQLKNWGFKYGLSFHNDFHNDSINQLDFWIQSTKEVFKIRKQYPDRILIVKYDQFFKEPEKEINNILRFINLIPSEITRNLYELVKTPNSLSRFKTYDISMFTSESISYVKSIGFDIE